MRVGIVGCGFTGLFTAYYLLKKGVGVTIIDVDPIGGRASENNAGFIAPSPSKPKLTPSLLARALLGAHASVRVSPTRLFRKAGWFLRALRSYGFGEEVIVKMARKSLELHLEFLSRERIDVDLMRGAVSAFKRWEDASMHAKRSGGRLLDEKDLRDLGYVGLGGGFYIEDELSINPSKLYWGLRNLIQDLGGEMVIDRARGIKIVSGKSLVITDRWSGGFDYIVIAAGSRSGELCRSIGYDPKIEPARGVVILHRVKRSIVGSPAFLEDYGVGIAQHGSEILRVTGFFELVGHEIEINRRSIGLLRSIAGKHLERYREAELASIGMGFRPCSADLLPVVGCVPGVEGVYIATGLCRLGVTMSPIAGKIVSSAILGEDPPVDLEVLKAISPARFGRARIRG